jgi:CDP-diacylglycerol--serine O-phosphatidyltransferase
MKHIPNFITSLNLTAGFIAILFTVTGDLTTASWFILAAMLFDFLDGLSARLLNAYSVMGKELDSLADLLSFGVAPAIMIFILLGKSSPLYGQETEQSVSILKYLVFIIPAIMPACAALRLAKFNTDDTQSISFKGLPTPANALAVISVIIADSYTGSGILKTFTGSSAALMTFTLILSLLMVSRIPMLSLKFKDMKIKGNEGRYLIIVLPAIAVLALGLTAAPLIIPIYIVVSLLRL